MITLTTYQVKYYVHSRFDYITKYNLRFTTCSAVYLVFSMKSSSHTYYALSTTVSYTA